MGGWVRGVGGKKRREVAGQQQAACHMAWKCMRGALVVPCLHCQHLHTSSAPLGPANSTRPDTIPSSLPPPTNHPHVGKELEEDVIILHFKLILILRVRLLPQQLLLKVLKAGGRARSDERWVEAAGTVGNVKQCVRSIVLMKGSKQWRHARRWGRTPHPPRAAAHPPHAPPHLICRIDPLEHLGSLLLLLLRPLVRVPAPGGRQAAGAICPPAAAHTDAPRIAYNARRSRAESLRC